MQKFVNDGEQCPPRIAEVNELLNDLKRFTDVEMYDDANKILDLKKLEPRDDIVLHNQEKCFSNPLAFIYAGTEKVKISIKSGDQYDFLGLFGSSPHWTDNVFCVLKKQNINPPQWFSKKYDKSYKEPECEDEE